MKLFILSLMASVSSIILGTNPNFTKFQNITYPNIPDSLYPPVNLVIPYHTKWAKEHYKIRIREFKNIPLQMGDIVFIGNSIIEQGGNWGTRFESSKIKNRGISGDVTRGIQKRLGEICYIKPRAVFILCGINDLLAYKSPEFVVNNIIQIVKTIQEQSPATKVFVQTILPTFQIKLIHKISAVNNQLIKYATSTHYTIIDLHSVFAESNDLLNPALTYDGTHPNEEGYSRWVHYENHLIKQLLLNTIN